VRQKLGMAIIWITHDLGVIAGIADRVMVMYGGQVVEQAPVRELFANPQHPYTRALLQTIPKITGEREGPAEGDRGPAADPDRAAVACPFRARCEHRHRRLRPANPPAARWTASPVGKGMMWPATGRPLPREVAHA
jgi:oligopeptide transport system ATP-binding protein